MNGFYQRAVKQQLTQQVAATYAASSVSTYNPFIQEGTEKIEDLGTAIEPIVGKRIWIIRQVNSDYADWGLVSGNGIYWPYRRALRAGCYGALSGHISPDISCPNCGIYCYSAEAWKEMAYHTEVTGDLYLWGKIIICQIGYRAEYAYPKNLKIPWDHSLAHEVGEQLAECYGIPVEVAGRIYQPSEVLLDELDKLSEA